MEEIKFKLGQGKVKFILTVEHSEAGEVSVREITEICLPEASAVAMFNRAVTGAEATKKNRGLARRGKDELRLPTRTFILRRAGEGGEEIAREAVTGTVDNGF